MRSHTASDRLDLERLTLSTLGPWIPRASDVAIIDVPVHRNVGDLFILAASLRLLERFDCRIVYRAGVRDYATNAARRRIGTNTVIVGLGGGNFGDLYPRYQALRERVVSDFPRNRIVILPQSIHFADPQNQERAVRMLRAHRDIRIAVRDRRSLDVARSLASEVELLPDIVHALGAADVESTGVNEAPARGTVVLRRRDGERGSPSPETECTLDWPDVFPDYTQRLALAAALMPITPAPVHSGIHRWWADYAGRVTTRGVAWMRGAERVVTDRLHAAILARLADRPVTLADNAYGKLTAYYEAWWRDDPAIDLQPPR